jgi:multiple sugar transport system substrate-binding protein
MRISVSPHYKLFPNIVRGVLLFITLGSISGCSILPIEHVFDILTPAPKTPLVPTATPTISSQNPVEDLPTPEASFPKLTIWVPPQFNPADGSEAGQLMTDRLNGFLNATPGVQIHIRVKATSGAGGMLDSLRNTISAAPSAMPSLVLLSHSDLLTAASEGLIQPLEQISNLLSQEDWYDYARQLAQVNSVAYGLPFAGDALILLYRPGTTGEQASRWGDILTENRTLLFPASDPQAPFIINLYMSAGGPIMNDDDKPILDEQILTRVLDFFDAGVSNGNFPYWLSQYDNQEKAWQAYQGKRSDWLVTWSSYYLANLPVDTIAMPLPSLGTEPYTLANGWVWGISDPYPERRSLSLELAEYLVDSDFLAQWTVSAGYLPTRTSVMESWPNQTARTMLSQVTLSAQIMPSKDFIAILGPLLENAALGIIKQQESPEEAARTAVEALTPTPAP